MRSASLICRTMKAARPRDQPTQTGARHAQRRTLDSTGACSVNQELAIHAIPVMRDNVHGGRAMCVDDRPTIAAPDDDPYLWLEEIEGERALDFVEQQKPAERWRTFGDARLCRGSRHCWRRSTTGRTTFPMSRGAADSLYNLWKDANNPRGLWRRTTLERISQAKPAMGNPAGYRQARRRGKRGLAAELDTAAAGNASARDLSLSRGGSDAVTLREFDIDTKAFVDRRLHAAGSKERRRNGSMPTRCCCRAPMARAWRRRPATPEPSGCGGAARRSIMRR